MPQQTPDVREAPLEPQSHAPQLASRGDRLLAVIVDLLVALAVLIPVGIYNGYFSAAYQGRTPPLAVYLETFVVCWVWFFLVNGYLLKRSGQTVGKRFLDIRICDYRTPAVPPFWRLLLRFGVSSIVPGLLGLIGSLFSSADVLFIFRKNRRCIHDLLASTRVVKS